MNAMVSLTKTTPICSLCRDGCALILKPALFLATNFLNLLGWCCGFFTMFWVGGCIPCGDSFTSTLYFCKTNERNIEFADLRTLWNFILVSVPYTILHISFFLLVKRLCYFVVHRYTYPMTFIFLIYILHILLIFYNIIITFWQLIILKITCSEENKISVSYAWALLIVDFWDFTIQTSKFFPMTMLIHVETIEVNYHPHWYESWNLDTNQSSKLAIAAVKAPLRSTVHESK